MKDNKEKNPGYFNALAEASFKKNPDGKGWLYYPNGIFGKGRVVKDERTRRILFKFQKRMYMFFLPVAIFYGLFMGFTSVSWQTLMPFAILIFITYLWLHILIRGLPKSQVKLKYRESTAKSMRGLPIWYSKALIIFSSFVLGFGLITPVIFDKSFDEVSGFTMIVVALGVFGIALALFIKKFRQNLDRDYPQDPTDESESLENSSEEDKEKSTPIVKPAYFVALVLVVVLLVTVKVMNPDKKYSAREYWQTATIDSVYEVPEEALEPGNKNGGVLMWAAMATSDPKILSALVERGASINEHDEIFLGTPLTGAAGYSESPKIIKHLISLGADIHERVYGNNTALHIAAMHNLNYGIIEELVAQGANVSDRNHEGKTALDLATKHNNKTAIKALTRLMEANE